MVMFFGGVESGLQTDRDVTAVGTFRSGLKSARPGAFQTNSKFREPFSKPQLWN